VNQSTPTDNINYFDAAYEQTYPAMLRYALIKARTVSDVEDLLQNTYSRFYERICRTGSADIRDARAYLITLMNRELSRYYGLFAKRNEQPYADVPELLSRSAEELGVEKCTLAEIWKNLSDLSTVSQKAFILYYGFDMPVVEIADALSMKTEAVKSRIHRARQYIKDQMKTEETV